tara:strand:- start:541 stop:918 length:378 start_codon:yes stop_codon:yes gene_type:complete
MYLPRIGSYAYTLVDFGDGMLPLMDPAHNLREVCKQLVLLEDHLTHPAKQCSDCIRKHFLTIEALLEEALALDKTQEYAEEVTPAIEGIRRLQRKWLDGASQPRLAQQLRQIRKRWSAKCFHVSI